MKFNKCIQEIISTSSVGVGSNGTEGSVPANSDSYATGDARVPTLIYKKKKKKKINKEGVTSNVFDYPIKLGESFKLLRNKFSENGLNFKNVTSFNLTNMSDIDIKGQILTDVVNKSKDLDGKIDKYTHDLKNILSSLEPFRDSGKTCVLGSFIKGNKIGITWLMV